MAAGKALIGSTCSTLLDASLCICFYSVSFLPEDHSDSLLSLLQTQSPASKSSSQSPSVRLWVLCLQPGWSPCVSVSVRAVRGRVSCILCLDDLPCLNVSNSSSSFKVKFKSHLIHEALVSNSGQYANFSLYHF